MPGSCKKVDLWICPPWEEIASRSINCINDCLQTLCPRLQRQRAHLVIHGNTVFPETQDGESKHWLPGNPRYSQVLEGIGRYSNVFSGIPRCYQVFPGIPRYCHIFPGIHRHSQAFPGIPRYFQVFKSNPRYSQVFPGTLK